MTEIAGDRDSASWTSSRPVSRGAVKAPWLADAIAKFDKKKSKAKSTTLRLGSGQAPDTEERRVVKKKLK
jgi:hypothetical protein